MKRIISILAVIGSFTTACDKMEPTPPSAEYGWISLACNADSSLDITPSVSSARTRTVRPQVTDFALRIQGSDYDQTWPTVQAYNNDTLAHAFKEGDYTLSVSWGDPKAEGADKPCYMGSTRVHVTARQECTAQITAAIQNAQVTVHATEAFKRYYNQADFTLTAPSGQHFTFHPCSTTPQEPVWVPAGSTVSLAGTAHGQSQDGISPGPLYTFTPEPLKATRRATRHIFQLDAPQAGSATLTITLGEGYTETRELVIELNDQAVKQR